MPVWVTRPAQSRAKCATYCDAYDPILSSVGLVHRSDRFEIPHPAPMTSDFPAGRTHRSLFQMQSSGPVTVYNS